MTKPFGSFDKDCPISRNETPAGIDPDLKLNLSDFLCFDSSIKARKYLNGVSAPKLVGIYDASKYFNGKPSRTSAARFCIDISAHDKLRDLIPLPKIIKEKSLFELCWPYKHLSTYLKYRGMQYHQYSEGHVTRPSIAYGGATEWLYIHDGTLEVDVIQPTDLNLHRYRATLDDDETEFQPVPGTATRIVLKGENFLIIPAGLISIKRAVKHTCAYVGELWHSDNLARQLELFERDVIMRHDRERDSEIRHMIWFYASYLWTSTNPMRNDGPLSVVLKKHLHGWRTKHRKIETSGDCYEVPTLYAPHGLVYDSILKNLRRVILNNELEDSITETKPKRPRVNGSDRKPPKLKIEAEAINGESILLPLK